MGCVIADTHAALWFMEDDKRLTLGAAVAMQAAERILLPSICLVEIIYLVEKGRLQPAVLPRILAELDNPATTLQLVPLDLGVILCLQNISRSLVPDMPDRIIAATADHRCFPVVTCDPAIRDCGIKTIW